MAKSGRQVHAVGCKLEDNSVDVWVRFVSLEIEFGQLILGAWHEHVVRLGWVGLVGLVGLG